jgi:hypothetical protein
MDETQTALQALRELLDNPDRVDWDKLAAASRALIKAIETGQSARQLADVIMIDRRDRGRRESDAEAEAGGGRGAHQAD